MRIINPVARRTYGTQTNDSAAAGYVGELIESTVLAGAAVSLTDQTQANVTSISLTAGDWDVWADVGFAFNVATVPTRLSAICVDAQWP